MKPVVITMKVTLTYIIVHPQQTLLLGATDDDGVPLSIIQLVPRFHRHSAPTQIILEQHTPILQLNGQEVTLVVAHVQQQARLRERLELELDVSFLGSQAQLSAGQNDVAHAIEPHAVGDYLFHHISAMKNSKLINHQATCNKLDKPTGSQV